MKNNCFGASLRCVSLLAIILFAGLVSKSQIITTIAGQGGSGYNGDGIAATAAQLNWPYDLAVDTAGNMFILDRQNWRVRKVDATGTISTIAGTGVNSSTGDGGPATAATIMGICITLDSAGNLFIGETGRLRKIVAGVITTIAGTGTSGFSGDGGAATAAQLTGVGGIAADRSGNVYLSDVNNHRIRMIDASGTISTIAGTGTVGFSGDGGAATTARLASPYALAFNRSGELFFCDYSNNRVRKITRTGIISTVAGNGSGTYSGDGAAATAAGIYNPKDISFDTLGNLYIAVATQARLRKVDTSGIITTFAGNGNDAYNGEGMSATATTLVPNSVETDIRGNIFLSDVVCARVRKIDRSGVVSTLAGMGHPGYSGDGAAATSAQLQQPCGVFAGSNGNIYIADYRNYRIRRVAPSGIITTFAGNGNQGNTGDGGPATAASFSNPRGVAVDRLGNIYICDFNYIRKITPAGTISTIAGGGTSTSDGVRATTAALSSNGLTCDTNGNVFFTDGNLNKIRKISTSGIVTTLAGTGTSGFSGDGGAATAANLSQPTGVYINRSGELFFADAGNNRIRKISTTGIISTVAGNGTSAHTGDGGPATAASITTPVGIVGDASGNLYFGDNYFVRKVSSSGIISSIAGIGFGGYTGDGGAASSSAVFIPYGVTLDTVGNLYFSDQENHCIRKISNCTLPAAGPITGTDSVCPGATITLSTSGSGGSWSSSNSAIASVNTATGAVTGVTSGTVSISYMASNTCGTAVAIYSVTVKSIVDCPTAVMQPVETTTALSIFPNPTTGTFTLRLTTPADEEATVTITNVLGQKVWTQAFTSNRDVAVNFDVAAGMYLVRVTGKNGMSAVTHVVKE